jgi:hypothetical protein
MLGYLTAEKQIRTADPLGDTSLDSFVEKASRASGRRGFAARRVPQRNRRRDFIQALEVLGAKSAYYRLASGDPLPRTIPLRISCPYRTWVKVFGKPKDLEKHRTSSARVAIHLWTHPCEDGPVTCIGQLSERLPGLRWVTIMRVGLYG